MAKALGDKRGLVRYGHAYVPLDEALSRVVIDLSGRGSRVPRAFCRAMIGAFDVDLAHEFFRLRQSRARHVAVDNLRGQETPPPGGDRFKAFARALRRPSRTIPARRAHTVHQRHAVVDFSARRPKATRMTDIAVVDYGMGQPSLGGEGARPLAPDRAIVVSADRPSFACRAVVLLGSERVPDCMRCLARAVWRRLSPKCPHAPVLGICLGLQMLFDSSEEGPTPGGDAGGRSRPVQGGTHDVCHGETLKVPHMGWSPVARPRASALVGSRDGSRFYFAHSFHPCRRIRR